MNPITISNLSVEQDSLSMDGVNLVKLAEEYGTPLYVFSEKRLRQNVREILDTFRRFHPKTNLHYASKAETTLGVLQVIHDEGSMLEVNSGGELFKGIQSGFPGEEIVFNGVGKTKEELEFAIRRNIKAIIVDSPFELDRLIRVAKRIGKPANVMLRIVPEVSTNVVKGDETGTHETKFGISTDELDGCVQAVLHEKETLRLVGLHFHIGTQTYNLASFVAAFRVLLETAIRIYKKTGYQPAILDIGGGLPVPHYIDPAARQYMPENIYQMLRGALSVEQIAHAVTDEMKPQAVREWAGDLYANFFEDCELILESGRKVVADAAVVLSKVLSEKRRASLDEDWLVIDAGLHTMLEVKTYHWYFPIVCANKISKSHVRPFKIAGPLCESGDVWFDCDHHRDLPDFRMLPDSTTAGDWIAILVAGAYGTPLMTRYNGRPMAGALMIRNDGSVVMIREPETFETLLAGEKSLF